MSWRSTAVRVLLALAVPSGALAHSSGENAASAWPTDPTVALPLLLAAVVHARGTATIAHRAPRQRRPLFRRAVLFALGYCVIFLALTGPLDAVSERLFTAHMLQHMLLMVVAAPLIALSRPGPSLLAGLPRLGRKLVVAVLSGWPWRGALRGFASPIGATALQLIALYFWHLPVPYAASADNDLVHTVMHVSFLLPALAFWLAMLPRNASDSAAVRFACLVITLKACGMLGFVFTVLSATVYIGAYASAPAWGMTAIEDQVLGGVTMMAFGLPAYLTAAMLVLAQWLEQPHAWQEPVQRRVPKPRIAPSPLR